MAAASMLAAFAPPVLLRPSLSLAPPRRTSAAVAVRAAAKAPAAAAAPKKKRATGITMPRPVSPALQAFVGAAEVPRTEAIKRLWAYIKQNNLQVYITKRSPQNPRCLIAVSSFGLVYSDVKYDYTRPEGMCKMKHFAFY
jgi:hypothetical protein